MCVQLHFDEGNLPSSLCLIRHFTDVIDFLSLSNARLNKSAMLSRVASTVFVTLLPTLLSV